MKFFSVLLAITALWAVTAGPIERVEQLNYSTWYLGMNLNPSDGHIMGYTTGWADDSFIGTYTNALTKDYINRVVWREPVGYIAIVRHQKGVVDAVKVFRFVESGSLLSKFQAMDPGRQVVTEGGPIQESVYNAQNMADDPVFSVGGDLAFNWGYSRNGARIVLTGGYLSPASVDDDNTHGLGNSFACNPLTGSASHPDWAHDISNIQDCAYPTCSHIKGIKLQGTDHGSGPTLKSGPVYGNYAIYVSKTATSFPGPGYKLDIEVEVEPKYKFF